MEKIYKILFTALFFIIILVAFAWYSFGQETLPVQAKVIEVTNTPPVITPVIAISPWNFLDKLQEAKDLIASSSLSLRVGKKDIVYHERRIGRDKQGNVTSVTRKKIMDPEREITLVLIDIDNGNLDLINIIERGNDLIYPSGYEIENVERPNGIINNAWNTCRKITKPSNKAIILNVWPHYVTKRLPKITKDKKGKTITTYKSQEVIENVVYAPYCDQIHIPEFIENGKNYRKNITQEAIKALRNRGVMSKAFPNKLIADVEYLKPEYFERLPLIEHMDYGEFTLDAKKSAERVDVILGTNLGQAYNLTCSKAKACGWLQYTKATWNSMRSKYSLALLPVFETGVADHLNSMVAAILLHDNNLAKAIKDFGLKVLGDPDQLEEILDANYNGGTVRPNSALKASILKSLQDWLINPMRTETKQYIEKVRYVRESYN